MDPLPSPPTIDPASLLPFDVAFVSFPKCGRTWLRLLIGHLLTEAGEGEDRELDGLFDTQALTAPLQNWPTITFSHDDWPQWKAPHELTTDKTLYKGKIVVLLVRDIRDVLVSHFFQLRLREGRADQYATLSQYLRGAVGSTDSFLAFYNNWWAARSTPRQFELLRYEDLHRDPDGQLGALLSRLGCPQPDPRALRNAVAACELSKLRERAKASRLPALAPTSSDPESHKFRRGLVGGYRDYLTAEDEAFLAYKVRQLEPAYEY